MTTSNVNQRDDAIGERPRRNRSTRERTDAIFDVLSDARRRRVIRILRTREGAVAVPRLAETLAAREEGERCPDQLVVSLQHVHLPKLDATGIVEYTAEPSRVRYDETPLVERLLDQL